MFYCTTPLLPSLPHLGVDTSKDCCRDAHIAEVEGKRKAHVGKTRGVILTEYSSALGLKMYCDERDSTEARIRRRTMGREREIGETAGNSTDGSS